MAIEQRVITEAVAGLGFSGNEEGLIPAFGLYLTKHPADYYNRISYGLLGAFARENPELEEDAIALLTEAGHVCAFHTFGGIMSSVEWDAVVMPMIQSLEDWVYGMVAVVNAFGWGYYEIKQSSRTGASSSRRSSATRPLGIWRVMARRRARAASSPRAARRGS